MDRCSIVNCGSMMVLGIGAGPFTPILPPARRGEPLDRDAIVTAAARAEGHPDNVAAAVLGGLAVSCADGARVTAVSLPVPREIAWVVLVPETESSTREARAVLPDSVPRADAVFNVQRVSLRLAGLGADRPALPDLAFEDRQVRKGGISYGLSSYGYDIRIADEFKIFTNINTTIVDPKGFDPRSFVDVQGEVAIIPPNSFALGRSVEYFKIPRNVLTICVGKSTYARCGIITNVTPFEPEWEGYVTLEISNTTPLPAKIYANEGIAQVLFFESDEACETSYADRQGKYQGQQGIVLPTV